MKIRFQRNVGLFRIACGLGLVAALTACSSFEREWKAMGKEAEVATLGGATGVEGRWSGVWFSLGSSHKGELRCMIVPAEKGDGLEARYHSIFAGILTFEYTVPMKLEPEPDGEGYRFSSEVDLGDLAGGTYYYEGTIIGDEFKSSYASKTDNGMFWMTREDSPVGAE